MRMIIRNESMRLLLISLLVTESAAGQGANADRGEIPQLSVSEIAQLAKLGKPELSVTFDPVSLQHALQTMRHVQSLDEQLRYFLVHGASNSLLAELFHMSANAVKAKRKFFNNDNPVSGKRRRPPMPNASVREQIHQRWFALRQGSERLPPKIQDYRELHEAFSTLSLATLYAVINEFDD
jgi:Protein of unknown function (DUF2857)